MPDSSPPARPIDLSAPPVGDRAARAAADPKHVFHAPDAIKVTVPTVHQPNGYSCGAACTMAVLTYFGVGPETYKRIEKVLGTSGKRTDFTRIEKYANKFARKHCVHARAVPGMTDDELVDHLDHGRPVICSIQAYGDGRTAKSRLKEYELGNNHGHYVVAVGYDAANFYFMDPWLIGQRGFIPRADFDARWHDDDRDPKTKQRVAHLGIVFWQDGDNPRRPHRARRID